ncbi:MAG: hypothetical protein GXP49_16615 [Deltaproteobacteria bacterium]|nr:hypothetical protein [Deltaproteobacteria bacterium]
MVSKVLFLILTTVSLAAAHPNTGNVMYCTQPKLVLDTAQKTIVSRLKSIAPALVLDKALCLAARDYGRAAVRAEKTGMNLGGRVLSRISWRNGVPYANVMPLSVESKLDEGFWNLLENFVGTNVLGRGYTAMGVFVEKGVITLLFAMRPVFVKPVSPVQKHHAAVEVTFESNKRLVAPRVLMATPKGKVRTTPTRPGPVAGSMTALISPVDGDGRYLIELLTRGPNGPVVDLLFPLFFGVPPFYNDIQEFIPVQPLLSNRDAALQALDVLRQARRIRGLKQLRIDPDLSKIAYNRARQVVVSGSALIHRFPGDKGLLFRMKKHNLPVGKASENLAIGPSPREAAFACLESPSHLANLVDPRPTHTGLAVLPQQGGEGGYVLVQVFAEILPEAAGRDLASRLIESINRKRKESGLAPLVRSEVLTRIAVDHCKAMVREGILSDELPGTNSILEDVRQSYTVDEIALDLFATWRWEQALDSEKVLDPKNSVIGASVLQARGNAAGKSTRKYWMVIIYGRR